MNYKCLKKMGEGTYGVVQKAQDSANTFVAIKTYKIDSDDDKASITTEISDIMPDNTEFAELTPVMLREITILRSLQHDNIVRLLNVIHTDRVHLVFELLDTDLHQIMKQGRPSSFNIKNYTRQLLSAIAYCHDRCILHRDIKPQNLFIQGCKHETLKLGDFGLARSNNGEMDGRFTPVVVTIWYRAPELLLECGSYSSAIDIWSTGCVMGEMIAGRTMFPGVDDKDMVERIMARTDNLAEWPEAKTLHMYSRLNPNTNRPKRNMPGTGHVADLLLKLLNTNPKLRISAAEALQHVYFLK